MELKQYIQQYMDAILDAEDQIARDLVHLALTQGHRPRELVEELILPAMDLMIHEFNHNLDQNLAQHYLIARISEELCTELFALDPNKPKSKGKVVFGTSFGDLHTLGKRIVSGCLRTRQIEVIDLGVNLTPETFVDQAMTHKAQVIAISSMMSHTARSPMGCMGVREILRERQLESQIKIVVGGAPFRFDPELYLKIGADSYADNALEASQIICQLIEELQYAHTS